MSHELNAGDENTLRGMDLDRLVSFRMGGMRFEYDEVKNQTNIKKHGISFMQAARVFLIMTESNYMTKRTAMMKTDMIQ